VSVEALSFCPVSCTESLLLCATVKQRNDDDDDDDDEYVHN